ncbi:MAG: hypothetical protein NC517_09390 [Firmicutes bacterium]|nr:hypothetical protein [Bacillota bacterium]
MDISRMGRADTYTYISRNQNNNRNKGAALFDRVGAATASDFHIVSDQNRLTAYGAYRSMSSRTNNKISLANLGVQVSGNLAAVQNDKYAASIYTEEGVKGHWRIYNKETGETMSFDPKLTSSQIDPETGKKYLTETDQFGGFMGAWGVDASLEELLEEFMGVDELQYTDVNENFTLERDKTTGIVAIKKKGAEGNGGSMIIEDEEQAKKLDELANIYLEKYPSLVKTKEMALNFAIGEIMGTKVRDETGVLSIGIGGMVYYNAQDPAKGWGILYSGYDSTIYSKIKEAFESGAITGNMTGDYKNWVEWLTEKDIDFELTTTEEDMERLQEEQTRSEIVVKPDGSRVLMVTMSVGGMETTMSLEISKPTEAAYENLRQDTNNHMSTVANDVVSDEISAISNDN